MFKSQEFSSLSELTQALQVTEDQRQHLFKSTVDQATCALWKEFRVGRLTASKFGEYLYKAERLNL